MNVAKLVTLATLLFVAGCGDSFWIREIIGEDGFVTCLDPRIGNIYTALPYDDALEQLRQLARDRPCDWEYPYIEAGECDDGETLFVQVVQLPPDLESPTRFRMTYYDATSLQVIGFAREGTTECWNGIVWPRIIECVPECRTELINYCEEECLASHLGNLEHEPDYETTLANWRAEIPSSPEDEEWRTRVAGSCGDGRTVFLHLHTGLGASTTLYDAETGEAVGFVGLSYDFQLPPCYSTTYWPAKIECPDQIVTEVISGPAFEVGDRLGWMCD